MHFRGLELDKRKMEIVHFKENNSDDIHGTRKNIHAFHFPTRETNSSRSPLSRLWATVKLRTFCFLSLCVVTHTTYVRVLSEWQTELRRRDYHCLDTKCCVCVVYICMLGYIQFSLRPRMLSYLCENTHEVCSGSQSFERVTVLTRLTLRLYYGSSVFFVAKENLWIHWIVGDRRFCKNVEGTMFSFFSLF